MNAKSLSRLGRVVFLVGAMIGFVLSLVAIWNNIESTNYYFKGVKYAPFRGLHCPVLMAPTEKGIVTAVFNNPTDQVDNFFYRAEISGKSFSTRQIEDQIAVPPHQARSIQVSVDANDVDLMFFILVRMSILPNSIHRSQEGVCGIMVVNVLGLTGSQVSTAAVFLSFLGMAIGLGLWQRANTEADQNAARVTLAVGFVMIVAMLATSAGWWGVAIVLSVIMILLLVISLRFVII